MQRRGFTVVEIVITITIMAILLVLSTVSFQATMANSRDNEREDDIETLALQIESYYNSGNDVDSTQGQYPSVDPTNSLTDSDTSTNTNELTLLRNLDPVNIVAPESDSSILSSLIAATNNTQTTAGVTPQPTKDQYVYQPIAADGSLCDNIATKTCTKFNLYYRTEVDNTVKMITSRHQ